MSAADSFTLFPSGPLGKERQHTGRGGSSLLAAVSAWEEGVARFYTEGVGVRIPPGFVSDSEDAFFVEAAMSSLAGNEDAYWRRWALWVLYRVGLPAPEDYGERTRTEGRSQLRYADTPANRLIRVYERFHANSAEAWAARIEWRFLTDDAKAGAEVARLIGVLRAASVEADERQKKRKAGAAKGGTGFKALLPEQLARAFERNEALKARGVRAIARHVHLHATKERKARLERGEVPGPAVPTIDSLERQIRSLRKGKPD